MIDIAGKRAGHRMGALGAFATVAGILACEARLPTSADVSKLDTVEVATLETKLVNLEGDVGLEAKVYGLEAEVGQAAYEDVRVNVASSKAWEVAPPPPPK